MAVEDYPKLSGIEKLSELKRALLAKRLSGKVQQPGDRSCIRKRGDNVLPILSFGQQRLWYLDQLMPDIGVYNSPIAFRLRGRIDKDALTRSMNEIIRRHEVLRSNFALDGDIPVQVVASSLALDVPLVDLSKRSSSEREAELASLLKNEARKTFNLTQGPLVCAMLVRIDEEEHVLFIMAHHSVFDGWSLGIWLREFVSIYKAFVSGKASPLPELPIQYADFAVWQREWLRGEVLEKLVSYWKEQLSNGLAVLELPTDRPRPPVQTFKGAKESFMFSKRLKGELKDLSQREGVTLFMTLLSAFYTLLYRYTAQEDIAIGSVIANRNRSEIEGLIGFFVNTVVLKCDLSGNPKFKELLVRVRGVTLGAYDHQDLPFEKLVEELQPVRDMSRSPLFQVAFTLENFPKEPEEIPGIGLSQIDIERGMSIFDLTLSVREEADGIGGTVEYNTDLFDRGTVVRMIWHFQVLLEGIVANPEGRISEFSILTDAERHQLLVEWNDTAADFPRNRCAHELFEEQVAIRPDAVAVVFEDKRLTYQELNQKANQLAHYLQAQGVGPDALVGIYVERSLEMVVAILGVLKAGGAYLPLDPAYPKDRLAFMLEDAQVKVLLSQHRLLSGIPEQRGRTFCLDSDWEMISHMRSENPVNRGNSDSLAYLIYTSGSTGKPKGVQVPHQGLCNVCEAQMRTFGIGPDDRVLQFASLSFDAATFEIFLALRVGASLYLGTLETLAPGPPLTRLIRDCKISIVTLPPSVLALLPAGELTGLKIITVAGEACPASLVAQWREGRRFYNLYGPTEATIWSTVKECIDRPASPPIGRPICNTRCYILDGHLQPVPIGVPGELHIGGVGVTRGYLNQPELTAERFIPDIFNDEAGARLYKTGDLVRYLPNGEIEYLGRIDHQVKIRGFRIELGEIEAGLRQHSAVRDVVVVAREDRPGDKRLVAYLVMEKDAAPSAIELRSLLREKLPEYMIPSAFVFLDRFPLTPNNKVDRRNLPALDGHRRVEETYVAPRNATEEVLAVMWADVLGLEKVGIQDNFFDLGGNSLLLVRVHRKLERIIGKDVPMLTLLQYPSISSLCDFLNSGEGPKFSQEDLHDRAKRQKSAMAGQKWARIALRRVNG